MYTILEVSENIILALSIVRAVYVPSTEIRKIPVLIDRQMQTSNPHYAVNYYDQK